MRFCPGTRAPQPNVPLLKRAKSTALSTGFEAVEIRRTCPNAPSWPTTFWSITDGGPSTQMCGLPSWRNALAVGFGTWSRFTNRTESPERAAHAAAGIA